MKLSIWKNLDENILLAKIRFLKKFKTRIREMNKEHPEDMAVCFPRA